jgi:hypothetical protein
MSRLSDLKAELVNLNADYERKKTQLENEIDRCESGIIESCSVCHYCVNNTDTGCHTKCYENEEFSGKKVRICD